MIKLTLLDSKTPVYVNPLQVVALQKNTGAAGGTVVVTAKMVYHVAQSIDQVMNSLNSVKFSDKE